MSFSRGEIASGGTKKEGKGETDKGPKKQGDKQPLKEVNDRIKRTTQYQEDKNPPKPKE